MMCFFNLRQRLGKQCYPLLVTHSPFTPHNVHILVAHSWGCCVASFCVKSALSMVSLWVFFANMVFAATTLTIPLNQGQYIKSEKPLDTIFVANPEVADYHLRSPTEIYVFSKNVGTTTLYVKSAQDKLAKQYTIKVIIDATSAEKIIRKLFPNAHVQIIPIQQNAVALKGTVASASDAEAIYDVVGKILKIGVTDRVNLLKIDAPTQINLRVEIVEISRELKRHYGVDWLTSTPSSSLQLHTKLLSDAFIPPFLNQVSLSGFIKRGDFSLTAVLHFLEENNLATILSEPNLTAQSGETASFLVGGEFPVLIPAGIGQAPGVQYKKYGVSLDFSPTALAGKRIHLQMRSEVSEITNETTQGAVEISGVRVPAVTTRQASTAIELKSGQSFAIAGLLQNNANKLLKQLPALGNVPIIGALFRSQQFQRKETELIIIVTPYLVSPSGARQLTNPLSGLVKENPATHHAAYCQGKGCNQNIGFLLNNDFGK